MTFSLQELKTAVSGLPAPDRAELAHFLLHTLEPPDEGAGEEWAEVASDRMDEVRSGAVQPVPADEVWQSVKRSQ